MATTMAVSAGTLLVLTLAMWAVSLAPGMASIIDVVWALAS